ncbi:MAG: aspartate/glutamate racemase family protein [Dehalococcoidales bacterium]
MKIWYQSGLSFERFKSYEKYLREHLEAVADPGVQIELHGTTRGGTGVEYRFTEYFFTREILENSLKAEQQGFDAFTIGTTNDAGLYQAREVLGIPVIGISEASMLVACMMGRKFSLITPNEKMIPRFEEMVNTYGLRDKLASIEYMDFRIPELGMVFEDPVLQKKQLQQFKNGAEKTIKAGSEVIIPIGGIASLFLARSGLRQIDEVPVLDTISVAVKMTEMFVKLRDITGTFVSRKQSFTAPSENILKEILKDYGIN